MEKIIKERKRIRCDVVSKVKNFSECIKKYYKVSKVVLVGSYVRGDFNRWSDIDVLVIVRGELERNPLRRLDKIIKCMIEYPEIEPVIISEEEYIRLKEKKNPLILEAEKSDIIF